MPKIKTPLCIFALVRIKTIINFAFLLLATYNAYGQNRFYTDSTINLFEPKKIRNYGGLALEAKWGGGFIIVHSPAIPFLQQSHTQNIELAAVLRTTGIKPWHIAYGQPYLTLNLQHTNLGFNSVLGSATGAFVGLRFPLLREHTFRCFYRGLDYGPNVNIYLGLGSGLAYMSRTFDKSVNFKNVAVAGNISALVNLNLLARVNVAKGFVLLGGIGFTHFSNGAIKTPNVGLNIPNVYLGAKIDLYKRYSNIGEYVFYDESSLGEHRKVSKKSLPPVDKGIVSYLMLSYGIKDIYPPGESTFRVLTFNVNFLKPLTFKSGLLLTFDVFDDRSIAERLRRNNPTENLPYTKTIRPGVALGYNLTIGNMSAILQQGFYPYSFYKADGLLYIRVGLRYTIYKNWLLGLTLKSHWGVADNLEFGLGYKLVKTKSNR